ncbi:MAG: SMP-30/gluconolactonase/LRE family protein, partial [Chitinophagaceae bacterium]
MNKLLYIFMFSGILACKNGENKNQSMHEKYKTTGVLERLDPALDNIISPDAKSEIIAEGFDWSEGPLWVEKY